MNRRNLARLKLLGVFMVFLGPLGLSYFLYYGLDGMGLSASANHGQLLQPAERLPELALEDAEGAVSSNRVFSEKWSILQVAAEGCDDACQLSLERTRQIWALLHTKRSRVQRVLFLADEDATKFAEQPRLEVYRGNLAPLLEVIAEHDAQRPGAVYLIDPLGNWVLYYPPEQDGEGLYRDIRHLLSVSHIG